ncbi:DUF4350 domain-containing protein [Novosphingobium guangzhouense]|uniref:ABC transporter n=1 Tax=Novosphingobium guangzhouense TaxID=1850347 RepID=A0A2K2FSX6_9SPHN|nr:DUF4350 domain-containing protein [Novosphingobium guangzhouense]PNU01886.1 ABC transporter [Novosphingobium guangzhouense]
MTLRRKRRPDLALLLSLLLAACGQGSAGAPPEGEVIGLYSSLPIAWKEAADIRGLLADEGAPHWAMDALQQRGRVVPLDTLADAHGALPLPKRAMLVLAQPRPLTAQENVALDAWVRAGGRVLLFADPMLTSHSLFSPGDPRRPQDIVMLSPILGRWGLELQFDDAQGAGERLEDGIPVNLPGHFASLGNSGDASGKAGDVVAQCRIEASGLLARCRSGKGLILAVADAALLENPQNTADIGARRAILGDLLGQLPK